MMIGWIPFLIWYGVWLVRRKPYRRKKTYTFRRCKFNVEVTIW